jgi:hypothetical protein
MKTVKPVGTATSDSLATLSLAFQTCSNAVNVAKMMLVKNYPHPRDYATNEAFYAASKEWLSRVDSLHKLAGQLHKESELLAR